MNQNTIVPNIGQWKIKEEFNVLSEFDGMSCGQLALQMAGKKVTNYFASEIDKYAIQIANKNFPNTKQLGDVTKINISKLPKIHLFIGGSPCQGFSFAGKQLNFSDPRSKLFFEFAADLRFIQEFINPEVRFFLENVKMKKEFQDVISRFLGVEPVEINSALVSAQNRKRLYWTNIKNYIYPEDEGILLKHILQENIIFDRLGVTKIGKPTNTGLILAGEALDIKGMDCIKRIYSQDGKSPTLTTCEGGHREPKIAIRATVQKNAEHTFNGKCPTLTAAAGMGGGNVPLYTDEQTGLRFKGKYLDKEDRLLYRKLTPIECERLQTVPDNYTEGVSNSQRYKMLGNGWTAKVPKLFFDAL